MSGKSFPKIKEEFINNENEFNKAFVAITKSTSVEDFVSNSKTAT